MSEERHGSAVGARAGVIGVVVAFLIVLLLGACKSPELPRAASLAGPPTPEATPTPTPEPPTATPIPAVVQPAEDDAAVPTSTAIPIPGLTDSTVRIGVIADLDTAGVADGLSVAAYDSTRAWAGEVNANGGLAGRTVEIVVADSKIFFHAEAVEWVCSNDIFALVGSAAIQDGEGVELLVSNACEIPDFPATALMSQRRDSSVTIMSNPFPRPFYQAGPLAWLAEEFPEASQNAATFASPLSGLRLESERMREAAAALGYTFVYDPVIALEQDFSVDAEALEEAGAQSLVWTGDPNTLLELLQARAFSSGAPFDFVLCNSNCYSNEFIERSNGLAEGVSTWIPHLPFSEPSQTPELVTYLFALATHVDEGDPSAQGVAAWAAGRLFERSVQLAVGAGTPEYDERALSRRSLMAAARTIDAWSANGIYAEGRNAPNPSGGIPSPCFVLMTVVNGAWVRQHPLPPGTMDCNAANRASVFSDTAVELAEPTAPEDNETPNVADDGEGPVG